MSVSLITPSPEADQERRVRLRRMRSVALALLVFAGEVIRPFAWVMAFGIFTGTFSSIYIAAPILLIIEKKWPGKDARGVKASVMPAGPSASAPVSGGIKVPTA